MSLRLRRGTDVERQSVVFAEGELVYTTDLKELYVGDGNTLGGIKVTSAVDETPIALTRDLDLNSFDIVGSGDIDINGAVTANVFYGSGAQLTDLPLLDVNNGAAYQIDIVGADSSIIVNSNTSTVTGNFVGNASGLTNFPADVGVVPGGNYNINVVGDDSTIIIDSSTNIITASSIDSGRIDAAAEIRIRSNTDRSYLRLTRTSSQDIVDSGLGYGAIYFDRDDLNGNVHTALIAGGQDYIVLGTDPNSIFPENTFLTITYGNLGIGTYNPLAKLDVRGDGKFSGYVQFGSYTTTERDAIAANNGMIIYNTTDNRFQGYQNNVWINLDDASPA